MKARITPKKEIVLLYHLDKVANKKALLELLAKENLSYREVLEEELELTTGELAGYQASTTKSLQKPETIPQISAMAMGGLSGKKLDAVLNGMKKAEIELPVKMVITPVNESWKFGELITEVAEEHELFMQMERMQKLAKQISAKEDFPQKQELLQKSKQLMDAMKKNEDNQPSKEDFAALCDAMTAAL